MNVYVNSVRGMDDAIISMFMSKPGSWSKELNDSIYNTVHENTDFRGMCLYDPPLAEHQGYQSFAQYKDWMDKVLKWGRKHITMLRFIDISITVEGLHRAGQDDLDAHAKRMDNRIIRNSTRAVTSDFGSKVSEWYEDKVVPTDVMLAYLGIKTPEKVEYNGKTYVRGANGYIAEDMKDNPDVKRGLYFLALPSNCIFKVNLTEFAHMYKLRNKSTGAHPELKIAIEKICDQLELFYPGYTRELLMQIEN